MPTQSAVYHFLEFRIQGQSSLTLTLDWFKPSILRLTFLAAEDYRPKLYIQRSPNSLRSLFKMIST
jgi:hypothetical protein